MCHCDCEPEFAHGGRGWSRGYGPRSRSERRGCRCGYGYGWRYDEPTKAERKQDLEAFKKHLEERLADVNDELGKL